MYVCMYVCVCVCVYIYIYIYIYIYTQFLKYSYHKFNIFYHIAVLSEHWKLKTVRSKKIVTVASCGLLSNKHQNKIGFTYSVNQNVAKNLLNFILTSNREYSYCKRCQISSSRWKYTHWICSWQRTCANRCIDLYLSSVIIIFCLICLLSETTILPTEFSKQFSKSLSLKSLQERRDVMLVLSFHTFRKLECSRTGPSPSLRLSLPDVEISAGRLMGGGIYHSKYGCWDSSLELC